MTTFFLLTSIGVLSYTCPALWLGFFIVSMCLKKWKFLLFFCVGLGYALGAHALYNFESLKLIQGKKLRGNVSSLVKTHEKVARFEFDSKQLGRVSLYWFQAPSLLAEGANCHLQVRLHPVKSLYLIGHHIMAQGYVKYGFCHQAHSFALRSSLRAQLNAVQNPMIRFIEGLTIGVRDRFTESDWQVLRNTGTNHLFVIAGLHIGFVSGLIYLLVNMLWRVSVRAMLWLPSQQAASIAALIAACIYASLAGFSIPTQRAVIMMSVFLIAFIFKRKLLSWHAWSVALFFVLLINPFSIYLKGFWLSFFAVAAIIYCFAGRVGEIRFKWIKLQLVLALALVPLGFWYFGQTSLVAPVANCLVVPWMGFIVVPLSLVGLASHSILMLACEAMQLAWTVLQWFSSLPVSSLNFQLSSVWQLLLMSFSVLLMLAPRGFYAKQFCFLFLLLLLFSVF